jgi:hypothetical protein
MDNTRHREFPESDFMMRTLNFVQEETNSLKERLSVAVQEINSESKLVDAEALQTRLIRQDEFISLMRYYLSEFNNHFCCADSIYSDSEARKRLDQLRGGVAFVENSFNRIKNDLIKFTEKERAA